jgi:hypothetical protein
MANCSRCGKEVGCACNLISGSCHSCYNKNLDKDDAQSIVKKKSSKRIVYKNDPQAPPNTEFTEILKTQGLSRQEKLKRINDILEKARQQL